MNGRHFADGIFQNIFLKSILSYVDLNFPEVFVPVAPNGTVNMSALVQMMAWRRAGDKPLFEPMVI